MALHPNPNVNILLPAMHPNIAQISRFWVAKTIASAIFDDEPLSLLLQSVPTPYTSTNQPSPPFNLYDLSQQIESTVDAMSTQIQACSDDDSSNGSHDITHSTNRATDLHTMIVLSPPTQDHTPTTPHQHSHGPT
jgi:hypothetical protein